MSWPAGSFLCTYCSVSALAAPPLAGTSAPLVVRSLLYVTSDSGMPTTGVPSAAINVGAAVKTSISKSAASGALEARGPCRSSTQHRISCGRSAACSDFMWRRFRSIHWVRRVSTGLRGRNVKQCETALWPPALASFSSTTAAEVPACIQTRLVHDRALETRRQGVPAVAASSNAAKWWRVGAPLWRSTSQYSRNTWQQHGEPTAARSSETQPLASAGHSARPPGSGTCRSTIVRVLEAAGSNVAPPRGSNGRVPTILADITERLSSAWAGTCGLIRAAAGQRHCVEREEHMGTRGSALPLSLAVSDCESRTAAEATPQVRMRGRRYGSRSCSVVISPNNLCFRIWTTSSCLPRAAVRLAGSRVSLLEPDSFKAHEKTLVVHGVSSIVRNHFSTSNSRDSAFNSSRAAAPTSMILDGLSANAISEFAAGDAISWLIARDFLPAGAAGAVARAREKSTSEFLTDACVGPRKKTAAVNAANATKATTAAWVKTWFTVPLTVLLQQRRAASYFPLPPCRTVLRKWMHLCNPQPESRMRLLGGRLRRYLSAWLFSTRHDRRYTEIMMSYERQRSDSVNKVFTYIRMSSISSSAKLHVFNGKTRHALPLIKPLFSLVRYSGSGSGTKCAADAAAAYQGGPRLSGDAVAPASAAASIATVCLATSVVNPALAASGRTRYHGGFARLYTGVTRLPRIFIPLGTPWLELDRPLCRRHYGAASRGLELCGNISPGASVDTSISARAASSSGAVAAAAASGQQQLPTQKTLLSFDACTIRIPHPNKRDKGGEDASACSPRLLVVADGVGGWGMSGVDAGLYSRELVQRLRDVFEECCDEKHMQQQEEQQQSGGRDSAIEGREKSMRVNTHRSVVFERTPDPVQLLKAAYLTTRAIGSSTCCLVVLDRLQQRVRCANIGDSGFILYRPSKDTIVARSNFQSHDFNFPLQLGTGSSDMPEHAHVLEIPVQEGDVFLLATDGVWDNLYDEQVLEVFRRDLDVHAAAEELSQLAFKCSQDPTWNSPFATKEKEVLGLPKRHAGGKPDDITVVVAVLKGDVNERTEAGS